MSGSKNRKSKPETAGVSGVAPATQPPRRDANGAELDAWGLPLIGPLRTARLAQIGKPDPNLDPGAWDEDVAESLEVVAPALADAETSVTMEVDNG